MKNNGIIFQQYGKEDLSKEFPPIADDVRLSEEGNSSTDSGTPVSVTPIGRDENHKACRDRACPCPDIAIIGMSGRFAGSPNLGAFWSHLQAGESCIEPIRRKGWQNGTHSDPTHANPSKWGGMLEHIDQFDPLFFNISPLEAARMDPQQRLFLEEAYRVFEDAGYCAEQLSNKRVGVFVGARSSDYKEQALRRDSALCLSECSSERLSEELDAHLFLGNDMAILAARISYFLNLKGPNLTIDTASSSSLVAIHLACESIHTGESEMALAGGVFVMSSPEYAMMASKMQMLSPDGKCKTFDKSANGIVIGEGVGALVLKPLDAAIEDGDHIYGVILGSAMNQDGKTFGMTAPSMLAQKDLLVSLYKKAAIHPETVSYIEAHGTGSKLGDPIEVQALKEAFRTFTEKKQFCAIGSHKPNIGHTISSAGIAGVLKVLLAMKYQQLPPAINVEEINPEIDFQSSPFFLNTELREWKSSDGSPRRAGVSSFGLSGTNCHLILEGPPPQKKTADERARPSFFFPLSAKTRAALKQKVEDMINWVEKEGEKYAVEDISYTLVQCHSHFSVRSAVVAKDTNELKEHLREIHRLGSSELAVENGRGHSSEQTELLLKEYGTWLLQELREYDTSAQNRYKEKIVVLAEVYVKGYNLDWNQLFSKGRYFRVPLPTYPFTRESYWVTETPRGQSRHLLEGLLSGTVDSDHEGGQELVGRNERLADPGLVPVPVQVLMDRLREVLSHMVSNLLKVRVEEIDIATELSEYGFDSITFTEFANRLNQTYQLDLTPAHFFEYSTLAQLAQYLHANYASALTTYFDTVSPIGTSSGAAGASARKGEETSPSSTHFSSQQEAYASVGPRRVDDRVGASLAPTASSRPSRAPAPAASPPVPTATPIAIIGMSGSFPQAPDVQSLWSNLLAGRDCIGEIPASRWDWQIYFGDPATQANRTNVKLAGIVEDVEQFDPLFFGISPREAEQMDPQQRLLMMYVWKAIEDAGYAASSLSGTNTALFVGTMSSGYSERVSRANMQIEGYSSTGLTPSVGPNRMSYFLNLHGPSEAIETACSSSLVAIHRGVSAIESGQCDLAIVGGVNTLVSPELHISYSKGGMLCEDGRCKTFSAQANGYVRGEGVGILVLKKLDLAELDGNHIYGVIRGSAENHGGRASSLTAPNPRAQADLLVAAYRKAGIDPRTVGYIEAHGTGTPLGDPIEINALKTAFSELIGADRAGPCPVPCADHVPNGEEEGPMPQAWCGIGSVKSNIGHLELAAGVVGVIKVLLQMQHKKLVKSLHCEQINPYIQLEGSPFYVVQENREWEALRDGSGNALSRRAGVSSFGFGGANAHVVLEEYVPGLQGTEGEASSPLQHGIVPIDPPCCSGELAPPVYTPLLIVLSARNEERLHEQVRQLLAWVQAEMCAGEGRGQAPFLRDLAYTLQVGREAMEERLALQVSSLAELEEKLCRYLQEPQKKGHWYRGQVRRHQETAALFNADEELQEAMQEAVSKWIQLGKYEKLLSWWVKGLRIEWQCLYTVGAGAVQDKGSAQGMGSAPRTIPTVSALPRRISLPTYPFARERYWILSGASLGSERSPIPTRESTGSLTVTAVTSFPALHPLVQRNTSTLWEQRFSSTFRGDEFFLADHVVKGERIMPGAAYLEMARAAVKEAIGADAMSSSRLHLSRIVWARPLAVGEYPVTVHITLSPQKNGTISFVISRDAIAAHAPCVIGELAPQQESTELVYCQGIAELHTENADQRFDLAAVQARCQHLWGKPTGYAIECYQFYRSVGLNYGPAFQAIEQLSRGEGEVLARFRLPVAPGLAPGVARTSTEGDCRDGACPRPHPYMLHPSLLDAALHASIGLYVEQNTLQVPFALDEIEIVGEVPAQGWAWIRRSPRSAAGLVFDIEVCDDEGHIAASLRGLSVRQFLAREDLTQTLLLTPVWKEEAIASSHLSEEAPIPTESWVFLCDLPDTLASRIQTQMALGGHCRGLKVKNWHSSQLRREQRFQDVVVQLIQELRDLRQSRPADGGSWTGASPVPTAPFLVQVVVPHREEPSFLEALVGVLKVAQQEYPKLRGQLIEVEEEPVERELLAWLCENQHRPQESHIRYRDGKRWVKQWQEYSEETIPAKMPWKEGGCYLISGGAGGLARLFVQEIARRVQQATVVLFGRSPLSREQRVQLELREGSGIRIDYQQVDVSDGPAVHTLIQRVLAESGHLDGIIHAAGVLYNTHLFDKTPEEVRAVLAPKLMGVEHLDEASREIPLDFFMLCSSLSAVLGGVGFIDYAAANAYLDAFAHARQALVLSGKRQGETLSINWPYWEAGGMQIDVSTLQMMRELLGEEPMGTETGMKTLYQALACGQAQVMVLHGHVGHIKRQLLQRPEYPVRAVSQTERTPSRPTEEEQQTVNTMEEEPLGQAQRLQERARAYFKKQLAALIKVPMQQIDVEAPLADYGFDSIMVIRLTNILEGSFGPLSKTLLFEYPTLQSVTEYFLHSYRGQLRSVLGIEEAPATTMPQVPPDDLSDKPTSYRETMPFLLGSHPRHRLALLRTGASPVPTALVRDRYVQRDKATEVGDIAIIGLAGRYPMARDLHTFWENLRNGRDCITEIPPERWDYRLYFDPDKNKLGTTYSKWGGFLDGVDEFDPLFFNISPREAEMMDPQERLFLECVFATLEDAGYTRDSWDKPRSYGTYQGNGLAGNVGVFVGVMYEEYQLFGAQAQIQGRPMALAGYPSSIANRVSYVCDFHGPSLTVDTACSSSLTAIHLACQSIQHGGCELAIAGGVNVSIHPNKYLLLGKLKFVSSSGHCESFGQGADGYVPGEGVGAILLKPLAQAEADGDHIYGVIKAAAINHGGKTNGYTVPNPHAQAEVIRQALKETGIDPRTISYIEAHGTGTVLGDPIEIAGLTRAFVDPGRSEEHRVQTTAPGGTQDNVAPGRGPVGSGLAPDSTLQAPRWCAIGSVKSNIGHAESAAGIAGVTKVLLQMRYGQLVPSLHTEVLNPHIDFSATPFVVQRELSEWKRPQVPGTGEGEEVPRRAGISSFGAFGSNAHVIIEEYVERPQANDGGKAHPSRPVLIVLSALTEERLNERVMDLLSWVHEQVQDRSKALDQHEARSLRDLAYTLQVGREAMEERLALQVSSLAELEEKLGRYLQEPQDGGDWHRGQVKRHNAIGTFAADEDGQKAIAAWMSKGKYEKLLELWVKGLTIDWKLLYGEHLPHRISLPTYPFARERYWIPMVGAGSAQGTIPIAPVLAFSSIDVGVEASIPVAQGTQATAVKTHGKGKVPNPIGQTHKPHSVALRPLTDYSVSSSMDTDDHKGSPLLSLPARPTETDELRPSIDPSVSGPSFSQSINNDEVAHGTGPMAMVMHSDSLAIAADRHKRTGASRCPYESLQPSLEEELARSLAQTLYMEQSALDVDRLFVDMGLDSVIGVEWIQSLNKQYAINLAASRIYDYPTIRQMAGFLQKELSKQQPTPVQPMSTLSLDDVLQQFQQGAFDIKKAEQLVHGVFARAGKEA